MSRLQPELENNCCIDLVKREERRAANLIDCTRVVPIAKKKSPVLPCLGYDVMPAWGDRGWVERDSGVGCGIFFGRC